MHHKTTVLVAPALQNSSCSHPRYLHVGFWSALGPGDVLQAFVVFMVTLGILLANMMLILVINSRRYSKYIHSQPRYLLTSLACNDLAMGLFVTPFAILPSLKNCWPYGELVCQIQALLRGAISQQSAVILICMSMDRYLCMLHPARYHKHSSKKANITIQKSKIEKLDTPLQKSIDIYDTSLPENAETAQFWKECCKNLEVLHLSSLKIPVSIENMKELKHIKRLYLVGEKVLPSHLTKATFDGLNSLEHLTLHNVGLEKIDEDAFENLPNLIRLTLSNNKITQLDANTFKPMKHLKSLDLTGNEIENLTLEMLSEQKGLTTLFLHSRDFFKFGAQKTKDAFPKLDTISLDYEDKYTDPARKFVDIIGICPHYWMKSGGFINTCI